MAVAPGESRLDTVLGIMNQSTCEAQNPLESREGLSCTADTERYQQGASGEEAQVASNPCTRHQVAALSWG